MEKKYIKHKNILSYAKYEEFELRELKLLLRLIIEYQITKGTIFSAQKIKKFINMDKKSYQEFGNIVRELGKKEIIIKEDEELYSVYHIFSKLTFNQNKKEIILNYTKDFLELIENVEEKYCRYNLKNIENLKSKYALLFYLRSRAELFKGKFNFAVEDLKKYYGEKYTTNNIDKFILTPAIEEINKYTDLNITFEKQYESQKRGRSKLKEYVFFISKKDIEIPQLIHSAVQKAKKNIYILKSKVLNKETIKILLDEMSEEELINGLNFAYEKINKDFTKLEYLKKVILSNKNVSIKKEIEVLESEKEVKFLDISDIENAVILDKQENLKNKKLKDEILKMEETLIEYLVKNENANRETLIDLKKKSNQIYENTLSRAYKKIKKEF